MPLPPDAQAETAADSDTTPPSQPPQRHGDALGAVPKLSARRARATR